MKAFATSFFVALALTGGVASAQIPASADTGNLPHQSAPAAVAANAASLAEAGQVLLAGGDTDSDGPIMLAGGGSEDGGSTMLAGGGSDDGGTTMLAGGDSTDTGMTMLADGGGSGDTGPVMLAGAGGSDDAGRTMLALGPDSGLTQLA